MPIGRFYSTRPLFEGTEILLQEEEAHHLLHVTRGKVGERVELVNGKNQLACGLITDMKKAQATIEIVEASSFPPPSYQKVLAQALPQRAKLDFILEKGTELGVTSFLLFPAELSEKSALSEKRMEKILISALKQCGRLDLPLIRMMPPLNAWEKIPMPAYFGDISEKAPLFCDAWQKEKEACFFVGPEGGFSEKENAFFRKHGVRGVKLHHNVLRTETAAVVALALMRM